MKNKTKHGSALLLTTILLFVVLSMVVSLTYVTVMEQKMSQKTKSSVGAFYNSESGIEWALNQISIKTGTIATVFPDFATNKTPCPASFGGANTCQIYLLDANGKVITDQTSDISLVEAVRSVGTQGNETTRAIEAAVAAGGSACFTYYCGGVSAEQPCTDHALPQGYCPSGFKQIYALGSWGFCDPNPSQLGNFSHFRPPGGGCHTITGAGSYDIGKAFVCCQ